MITSGISISISLTLKTSIKTHNWSFGLPSLRDAEMVLIVSKIGNLVAILFMQIRWSKTEHFAWEPGLMDSAYLNYAKKSGSRLLSKNAP